MPFKPSAQTFNASIKKVEIGTGDNAMTLGGANVFPLYSFDAPIENAPKVGLAVSDLGPMDMPGVKEFYAGCDDVASRIKRACEAEGVDFVCLTFEGADPNGQDRPIEECVEIAKAAAEVCTKPLVVEGSKSGEKDAKLLEKLAEALQGKNVLLVSAKEENYKGIAVAAGMAYSQKVAAESAVDINLAKQLNVVISQLGVSIDSVVMQLGTAAAGYGFEYLVSTMDRVIAAALGQNDTMLQLPIITPCGSDSWGVKEAIVSEKDFPEWGPVEERGINMEICTASSCIAAGSNAVILNHPESVKTVAAFVSALV